MFASPKPWLITFAEMTQWMTHEWKKSSSVYIPCPYFPNINSLLLVLFFLLLLLSFLKPSLEKLEDTPRQLSWVASHLPSVLCISSIYMMAFLHCFKTLWLFGVLLPPSGVIHPQSSLPFPPLALANSHPQNRIFIHLTTFYWAPRMDHILHAWPGGENGLIWLISFQEPALGTC